MRGLFSGQFGLLLTFSPIIAADNFPVNSSPPSRLWVSESLNEFIAKMIKPTTKEDVLKV